MDGKSRRAVIREAREAGQTTVILECARHGRTEFWVGRERVRCRRCNSQGVARRRRKVKEILVAEAGGCCSLCGYDRFPVALEFHHLDPETKAFGLSEAGITRSIQASRDEAGKCVLLCANCHAEVEAGLAGLPVQ
jgi:hypothetical protein